ncbi:Nucleoside-diphosphate-sugar epimerase [Pedobacter sp. ok626]|uniref:NAD-dependent epimerase/dehydratase family protein n=1 Tax=Pedobacter sp. ok626 TaxID=1761882 RepID=UPI0008909F2C|nr:NAD-dependent epimerase/dehydratase family protein [Pedobacter sp. ok626]SDL93385.1 Nucleoside-diphosphate-sugar epimerase [Pedobacter sp. ok626]
MHTILGAGGPSANALTRELLKNNEEVRLVSRRPVKTTGPQMTWRKADLLNYSEVLEAVKGSTVIYMCAGLVYDKEIWKRQWPIIMQNLINVAKETQARLLFFDNVYMYGLVNGPMLESTPYHPVSVKGEVRAKIATQLMDEVKSGNIQATIARAADFYGTDSMNSFLDSMVLDKFAKHQTAQWIGDPKKLHNFTYVPDTGKAMYLLGQDESSGNQIWHLPTAAPITGLEMIALAAEIFGTKGNFTKVNKLMLQMVGLFKKVVAGTVEMYYQYDHDYNLDSSKFEKAFNFKPSSYEEGIRQWSKTLISESRIS